MLRLLQISAKMSFFFFFFTNVWHQRCWCTRYSSVRRPLKLHPNGIEMISLKDCFSIIVLHNRLISHVRFISTRGYWISPSATFHRLQYSQAWLPDLISTHQDELIQFLMVRCQRSRSGGRSGKPILSYQPRICVCSFNAIFALAVLIV